MRLPAIADQVIDHIAKKPPRRTGIYLVACFLYDLQRI